MNRSCRICAVLTDASEEAFQGVEDADLVEVRADLLGEEWSRVASRLNKPWVFTDRRVKLSTLKTAVSLGAWFVDIDITRLPPEIIGFCKSNGAAVILFYHNFVKTPPIAQLLGVLKEMMNTGAEVCKIVTFARNMKDNAVPLALLKSFAASTQMTSFCMGELGVVSRIIAPLMGVTYASTTKGRESAAGQLTIKEMRVILDSLEVADAT